MSDNGLTDAPLGPGALSGFQRTVEVGVRIAPTLASAPAAAKGLAAAIDGAGHTPVRLAGLGFAGGRLHITIAVTLGRVEDVSSASTQARSAVALLHTIADSCAPYDAAFVQLPDPDSDEARAAASLGASGDATDIASALGSFSLAR